MDTTNSPAVAIIHPLSKDFSAHLVQQQHYDQVVDVFMRAFCNSEPMTKYVDMQYSEFKPFAETITEKAIQDKLSSVIIENKTGKVAALALTEDLTDPATLDLPLTKKFDPIFHLLEQLSAEYFDAHPPAKNQIAHLFISAVDNDFRGKGLSTQANFHAMKLAKDRRFTSMVSELTNFINERGIIPHLKSDKKLLGEIIYKDFVHQNNKPFEHLPGKAHAYLWRLPERFEYY